MSSSARETGDPKPGQVAPLIAAVLEVTRIDHRLSGFRYGELNAAGSLLLVPLEGRALVEVNGQRFRLAAGCAAWIAEAEWLRIEVQAAPWSYLVIRFAAPSLRAPAAAERVRRIGPAILPLAADLRRAWNEPAASASRRLRVHGLVSAILGRLLENTTAKLADSGERAGLWWTVETAVRAQIARRFTLAELAALSGTHRASLEKAARAATGLTPMRRLRQIRMSHAQTLLHDTRLLIKEVASAVGYPRIHEFSRDYRAVFGLSPRRHRADGLTARR